MSDQPVRRQRQKSMSCAFTDLPIDDFSKSTAVTTSWSSYRTSSSQGTPSQQPQSQHQDQQRQFFQVQQYSGQGSSQHQENVAGRYAAAPATAQQQHKVVSQQQEQQLYHQYSNSTQAPMSHTQSNHYVTSNQNHQMIPHQTPAQSSPYAVTATQYKPQTNANINANVISNPSTAIVPTSTAHNGSYTLNVTVNQPQPLNPQMNLNPNSYSWSSATPVTQKSVDHMPHQSQPALYPMQQQQQQQQFHSVPPYQQAVPMNNERPYHMFAQPPRQPQPLAPRQYHNQHQQYDEFAPILPDLSGLTDSNHPSSTSINSDLTESRHSTAPSVSTHNHRLLDKKRKANVVSPSPSCEDLLGLSTIDSDISKTSNDSDEEEQDKREPPSPRSAPKPPVSPRSPRSHPSITTYTNHYSESPLDKPTIAPPPIHPGIGPGTQDPYMRKKNLSFRNSLCSPLPKFDKIGHSGHVSGRCSAQSLILKKWKRMFWIVYDNTELFVFRNKGDFDEWAMNPYMGHNDRNNLVKLRVNFKKGGNGNLGVKCYRVTQLHSKEYAKMGTMCTFKLEQWMHHGPVVIGAFASNSKPEVGSLQVILNALIERHDYGVKHLVSSSDNRDDIAEGILRNVCTPTATSVTTSIRAQ